MADGNRGSAVDELFVYGTLRAGQPGRRLILPYLRSSTPATTQGRIVALRGGYPGLLDDPDATARVIGELIEVAEPGRALAAFDDYEGDEYHRVRREVVLHNGQRAQPWCYVLRSAPNPGDAEPIAGGDWIAYTAGYKK